MTYRWDSDFAFPYGWIEPKTANSDKAPTSLQPFNLTYPRGNGKLTYKSCLEKFSRLWHKTAPLKKVSEKYFFTSLQSLNFYF